MIDDIIKYNTVFSTTPALVFRQRIFIISMVQRIRPALICKQQASSIRQRVYSNTQTVTLCILEYGHEAAYAKSLLCCVGD